MQEVLYEAGDTLQRNHSADNPPPVPLLAELTFLASTANLYRAGSADDVGAMMPNFQQVGYSLFCWGCGPWCAVDELVCCAEQTHIELYLQ